MKIKVKKVKRKGLWYEDKIGEEFDVLDFSKDLYVVVADAFYKLYKADCTIIEEGITDDEFLSEEINL